MDVLYDVTNLGLSFGTDLTRTGIFRATESFVREVLRHSEVNARFAAMQSYAGEVQLARFDRSAPGLLGGRWASVWEARGTTLADSIAVVDELSSAGETSARERRLSATIMLLNRTARPRSLPQAFDVYHSLRSPLVRPEQVKARARVITIHDMIPILFPDVCETTFIAQHRALMASIDRHRDWIVCNSACTKADVCEIIGVDPARVFVTPFAATPDVFRPEPDPDRIASVLAKYAIPGRDYVLSLCTLEPRKNLPRLVRSFFTLVDEARLPDVRLVLVGATGWKSEALFASLDGRPQLRERIILTGFVPDDDLSALYSGARLFVFPSLYEGFGLPVLEAMQCGVPVITSRTSSLPEVVGSDAVTVDPTDEAALSQAMWRILDDPEGAAHLGRQGLQRAKMFSWSRTVEDTIAAYRAMLAAS